MTSFLNNPIFGTPGQNDVACWDLFFTQEEEDEEEEAKVVMSWNAIVSENGVRTEKRFVFTTVKAALPEEAL